MLGQSASGVSIISVTPFDKRGLDLDGTGQTMEFYAGPGADGLTILRTMGETSKLAHEVLAVREYVLWRRDALKSDAQRKPGPRVSREAAAKIDFMLEPRERATAPRSVRAAL